MPKPEPPFACPVCGQALHFEEAACACENGHRFDRAREGYVNLLPPGHSVHTGDSPEMVRARRAFLSRGYYTPLAETLGRAAAEMTPPGGMLLDAGCGEGYYTARMASACGPDVCTAGFDIAKEAAKKAAKNCPAAFFAVGGIFHMPILSGAVDCLASVFAPYSAEEFARVVRPGSFVLAVVPGRRHLFGVKRVVYDTPYENDEQGYDLPGFTPAGRRTVAADIQLATPDDIRSLFSMTPYFWKSPKEGVERLYSLETLETPIEFVLLFYRREG